jgi:hypothetical protein
MYQVPIVSHQVECTDQAVYVDDNDAILRGVQHRDPQGRKRLQITHDRRHLSRELRVFWKDFGG